MLYSLNVLVAFVVFEMRIHLICIILGRLKVNDLRTKTVDRENARCSSDDHGTTPRLLASSVLKDRNYI